MLTLKDINEASFGKSNFSGYKPEDVDAFLDEIADSYKQLIAEREGNQKRVNDLTAKNNELQEKLTVLAKKIDSYRKDEDGIKDAILSAQRVAKASLTEANEKVDGIIAQAHKRAEEIVDAAKGNAEREAKEFTELAVVKRREFEEIKKSVSAFKAQLVEMYKQHLEHIDNIPNLKPVPEEKKAEPAKAEPEVMEISILPQKKEKSEITPLDESGDLGKKVNFSENVAEGENEQIETPSSRGTADYHASRFRDLEFGDNIDVTSRK